MTKTMLTANFSLEEFSCPCCGFNNVQHELVRALQDLRDRLHLPVRVHSGCRCPKHNKAVGGAHNSNHLHGAAADISVEAVPTMRVLAVAELVKPFKGFGYSAEYLHVDVDGDRPARTYWLYTPQAVTIERSAWVEYMEFLKRDLTD